MRGYSSYQRKTGIIVLIAILAVSSFVFVQEVTKESKPTQFTIMTADDISTQMGYHVNIKGGPAYWLNMIYASLYTRVDTPIRVWEPDLAKSDPSIKEYQDGTATLKIELKEGLKFASGGDLTPADVLFSYKVAMSPAIVAPWLLILKDFFASNDSISNQGNEIIFEFKLWNIYSKRVLEIPIIEKATYEPILNKCEDGDQVSCVWDNTDGFFAQGAGPYRFVYWSNNSFPEILLEKNPYYWDIDNVHIDQIRIMNIIGRDKALNFNDNTTVDIFSSIYNFNKSSLDTFAEIDLLQTDSLVSQQFFLNHLHPVFGTGVETPIGIDDPDNAYKGAKMVRKAIAHLVDHSWITNEVYDELAVPATNLVPSGVDGYDDSLEPYEYNVTKGKSYMEAAGYNYSDLQDEDNNGVFETFFFNISQIILPTNENRIQWGLRFAEDLKKIGIGVNATVIGFDEFFQRTFNWPTPIPIHADGGYDIMPLGIVSNSDFDPGKNYTSPWPKTFNYQNYLNETLGKIIDAYTVEFDKIKRNEIFEQMQFHFKDEVVTVPVIYPVVSYGLNCRSFSAADLLQFDGQTWKNFNFDYSFCPDDYDPESVPLISTPALYIVLPGGVAAVILLSLTASWFINTKVRKEIREGDKRKKAEAEEYLNLARKIADQDQDES